MGWKENICDGIFNADGGFVADAALYREPWRWREDGQKEPVSQMKRLKINVDVSVHVATLCALDIENLDVFRRSGGGERDSVDDQRIDQV